MREGNSIYLDYNATAPVRPEVLAVMQPLLAGPFNPSSAHRFGREAKKHLEAARKVVAESLAAWPDEVVFVGSGTEGNNTALKGVPGRRLLVSAVEHSSVLKVAKEVPLPGPPPQAGEGIIPVTADGIIDLAVLEQMLAAGEKALVSVMLANNETGVIQPIGEIAGLCKKYEALLHCDAVQGVGKIPVDFGALGVDMMTVSSHKCGGPLGAAVLVVRRHLPFAPLLAGGGQESNRRGGTENVAAIAGMAVAIEKSRDYTHMNGIRGWLAAAEKEMLALGGIVFGLGSPRLPNTLCGAMPGVGSEVQLMDFDLQGYAVSAGSACSSGRIESSHVLAAMGVAKEVAGCAIRVSAGWGTSEADIKGFTEAWKRTCLRLGKKA